MHTADLYANALAFHKQSIARLVSLFEDTRDGKDAERSAVLQWLGAQGARTPAVVVGFTGTPGAGKSTLIAELCQRLLSSHSTLRIAVLAIDPSSHVSGGSILGDRTRMRLQSNADRLYYRSQASRLELGGVTHATFQAVRLLRHLTDLIFIETVGIGQNEIDIQQLADHVYLVMQPLAGDQIQFMKCGIMEIPDRFVINKCDEASLAKSSYYLLRSALKQARLVENDAADNVAYAIRDHIHLVSALHKTGLDPLCTELITLCSRTDFHRRERHYLMREIRRMYGEFGERIVAERHDPLIGDYESMKRKAIGDIASCIVNRSPP